MLTRLKVDGFKNLVDVDIHFGPFTCIAGANGVGKSNLFDAIRFLSALADHPFLEAAKAIRDEQSQHLDLRGLFQRVGDSLPRPMSFEAEMLVPKEGEDSLGQLARATTTFLVYKLELEYVADTGTSTRGSIRLVREELDYITKSDAHKHLLFKHSGKHWRESLGIGKRTSPFISTDSEEGKRIIKVHQDRQVEKGGGRTKRLPAASLPRTVLSDSNASESPTALLARLEMRSWKLLQFEPSALRRPDEFTSPTRLGMNGAHLAKSLYNIANYGNSSDFKIQEAGQNAVYARITNRLSELLDDVQAVSVDRDEKRELFTLEVAGKDNTFHPARALSDGTLRFLALAVLELERSSGVLCFEEPENGIHPQRIEAMLNLLRDIAVDTEEPVDEVDNPLRQVIVNTHSPAVVNLVPKDSLVVAYLQEGIAAPTGIRFRSTQFGCLPGTWRTKTDPSPEIASLGELLSYLNPRVGDATNQNLKLKVEVSVGDYLQEQLSMDY